ncbi:hypothetical protein O7635_33005 [Asanoa sp. WMMD1127]|uniref:hypothetical protein n=1 Tax=Asanoa sp. WMMD1127 TaxID=3016107 RepID=UPI002417E04D|nr:hypothetical protein [Asanoa sp. WMMD1127]MDG4826694.1 hypothetical protein [Asanoa sp. WMMD1127]
MSPVDSHALTSTETEQVRTRVRLLIELTSRTNEYRRGLSAAARRLSPEEAAVIVDLEKHGMQVPQLHDVLCGGHVLVDNPDLYENWRHAKGARERISSHHKQIDKKKWPDIGMRGSVVREKLHGRTAQGTWVQLEKTPAAFGKKKLPSVDDLRHLVDYFTYKITRSNVGPWGLSRKTERRPMYLSPDVAMPQSVPPAVAAALTSALHQLEEGDDVTSASSDLAALFPPPERADPADELGRAMANGSGRGLFGNSNVWVSETTSGTAAAIRGRDRGQRGPSSLLAEMGLS